MSPIICVLSEVNMAFNSLTLSFQIQYEISRVRQKMKDLAVLHDKHMNRPTLDDSSEEEHAIEITTQEITQVDYTGTINYQCSQEIMCIFTDKNLKHRCGFFFYFIFLLLERSEYKTRLTIFHVGEFGLFPPAHWFCVHCRCFTDASEL